jgi:pimeloyl-ACP methyl ester carboxylesterase
MKFILSLAFTLILSGCVGGDSSSSTSSTLSLQCDLNVSYTPIAAPIRSTGTGTPTTTIIALHGKSGTPTRSHMSTLANELNAQGYDVVMPYMSWATLNWNGTLCDGISYINSLVAAEKISGNSVILLGHSLGAVNVVSYAALENTAKPDALIVMAPGHFPHDSPVLANLHASSIQAAKSKVTVGLGDEIGTYQTSDYNITTTANIYLSFHDTAEFPAIKTAIPLVSLPTLWLAGLTDPLTALAETLGIIATMQANSVYTYKEIAGDHYTLVSNVTDELNPWYQGL